MLAVTHTITSAAIGAHVDSAPWAFGLAFVFHLFADTLLHWNIYLERHRWPYAWIALDVAGGVALAYWLTGDQFFSAPVLAAIVGGNLPDVWASSIELKRKLWLPAGTPRNGPFFAFHAGLQNETVNPVKGLAWQAVLVVGAVLLVL